MGCIPDDYIEDFSSRRKYIGGLSLLVRRVCETLRGVSNEYDRWQALVFVIKYGGDEDYLLVRAILRSGVRGGPIIWEMFRNNEWSYHLRDMIGAIAQYPSLTKKSNVGVPKKYHLYIRQCGGRSIPNRQGWQQRQLFIGGYGGLLYSKKNLHLGLSLNRPELHYDPLIFLRRGVGVLGYDEYGIQVTWVERVVQYSVFERCLDMGMSPWASTPVLDILIERLRYGRNLGAENIIAMLVRRFPTLPTKENVSSLSALGVKI